MEGNETSSIWVEHSVKGMCVEEGREMTEVLLER